MSNNLLQHIVLSVAISLLGIALILHTCNPARASTLTAECERGCTVGQTITKEQSCDEQQR